jgi:ABC-2 type transport system permease protein
LNDLLNLGLSAEVLAFLQALISPTVAYSALGPWVFDGQAPTPGPELGSTWFLSVEMMIAVLVAWVVVPLVVGYVVFRRSDLG